MFLHNEEKKGRLLFFKNNDLSLNTNITYPSSPLTTDEVPTTNTHYTAEREFLDFFIITIV